MYKKISIVVLIIIFIFISPTSSKSKKTTSTKESSSVTQKKEELKSLKEEIKEKKEKIKEVKEKEKKISRELEQAEKTLEITQKKLKDVSLKLIQTNIQKEIITTHLHREENIFKKEQQEFSKRLRQIYEEGPLQFYEILVGSYDFYDFLNRVEFLQKIIQYDIELINKIKKTKERIKKKQIELTKKSEEIKQIKLDVSLQEKEVKRQVDIKENILNNIKKERQAYEQALKELEETSREIELWIKKQEAQKKYPSKYTWPHKWIKPVSGKITSGFGWRKHPIFKITKFHTGIDIEANYGTPIVAAADGQVIFSNWWGGYGKVVIIDHGGGYATLYAHCSSLLVKEGQNVKAGQHIANVGSTGISTGQHLHFEIRKNGVPLNPLAQ